MPQEATAFAHRNELFLLKHAVVVERRRVDRRQGGGPRLAQAILGIGAPVGLGRRVPELPDLDLEDLSPAYYGRNHDRLLRVKARYDPEGFFTFHR